MQPRLRARVLNGLIIGVGLVALLTILIYYFPIILRTDYIGVETAQIKTQYEIGTISILTTEKDTRLTKLIKYYLGDPEQETEWIYMSSRGIGPFGIKASGWGESVESSSASLIRLLEPTVRSRSGDINHKLTKEAIRKLLANYLASISASSRHNYLFGEYEWGLMKAISYLDRQVTAADIPTLEEFMDQAVWVSKWKPRIEKLRTAWEARHPGPSGC